MIAEVITIKTAQPQIDIAMQEEVMLPEDLWAPVM
jgi:hypothetical protein